MGTETPIEYVTNDAVVRGILHRPAQSPAATRPPAVVFCHGWSGSRLGPHRMFVKTARRLSELGFLSLRIDFRGRGNSDGSTTSASIAQMAADTAGAVDYLSNHAHPGAVYLLGICSGGKVAVGAAAARPGDVAGLALWSAEAMGSLRNPHTSRRKRWSALKAYVRKLLRPATWRKIVSGRVNVKAVNKAVFNEEVRSEEEARQENETLAAFADFGGRLIFIYGDNDPDTKLAGENYREYCERNGIAARFHRIAGANHSFYSLAWEREVIDLTTEWLCENTRSVSREPASTG